MTIATTLDGILSAIVAGDPVALSVAKDYALDHLGANSPEEATARLIDAGLLDVIRRGIRSSPTDQRRWAVYASVLANVPDDPKLELVRLLSLDRSTLPREQQKRLTHLRATVSLLTPESRQTIDRLVREWAERERQDSDMVTLEDILKTECHPLLRTWGTGTRGGRRIIVIYDDAVRRWTWSGDNGQGGGGTYATREDAILAGLASLSPELLRRIRRIDAPLNHFRQSRQSRLSD